jgi:hypothetical protein
MENQEQKEGKAARFLNESPVKVFWPAGTESNERLVKLAEESKDLYITAAVGKEEYISDILLNVEQEEGDKELSFNVNGFFPGEYYPGAFKLLGGIFFIDKDGKKTILKEPECVTIENKLFYMPGDIYLSIDLDNGNFVFKNAAKDSSLHAKYMAFFLISGDDYKKLEESSRPEELSEEEKKELNIKAIDGYENLSPGQQEEVDKILDKIIYGNKEARLDKFKDDFSKEGEEAVKKLAVPLKEDGTVDIDVFVNQACPEYADEEVDMDKIEFEKTNPLIPFLNERDFTNLGYIGFSPKDLKNLVSTQRDMITDCGRIISSLEERLDSIKGQYGNSYSTCQALIKNKTYDSAAYDVTIKNQYGILAEYVFYNDSLKTQKEMLESCRRNLASFQMISRKHVKNALENGEFTNKHTFASINVFYKAMKDSGIIKGSFDGAYTVYHAYLKYLNAKFKELNAAGYFDTMMINALDPEKSSTVYSVSINLLSRTIRNNDLKNLPDSEHLTRLLERVQNRVSYLYDISYYPVSVASRAYEEMTGILAFSQSEALKEEYSKKHEEYIAGLKERRWPLEEKPPEEEGETAVVECARMLREKLNNAEIVDAISGFFRMACLTTFSQYLQKLSSKCCKTHSEYFRVFTEGAVLSRVYEALEIIGLRKARVFDEEKKEETEERLDSEEVKVYIGKFLIELACFAVFTGGSIRLGNLISEKSESLQIMSEKDAQTFFSVILNGLILPIEVLDKTYDRADGNEQIDAVVAPEAQKLLGKEAVKLFYSGLKGENNLLDGRKEIIRESVIFTKNVFKLVNAFIDELTPA